jgi:multisubunit Na+/H+ antiporter MnhF subunit
MIAFLCGLALCALLAAALWRLVIGPTLHDRALAAHTCVLLAALAVAALAALDRRVAWIDVAIALLVAEFVLGVAIMKAFRARSLQSALSRPAQVET